METRTTLPALALVPDDCVVMLPLAVSCPPLMAKKLPAALAAPDDAVEGAIAIDMLAFGARRTIVPPDPPVLSAEVESDAVPVLRVIPEGAYTVMVLPDEPLVPAASKEPVVLKEPTGAMRRMDPAKLAAPAADELTSPVPLIELAALENDSKNEEPPAPFELDVLIEE